MYRIFLVEDDETIAKLVRRHLEKWDYDVHVVQKFDAVMSEFASFDPHLVLMDIGLPFYNGYHWCTEIRRVSKVPVVFLSSAADNMNIVMAVSMGADDFIAKPFDLDVLTVKIQAIIRRCYDFGANNSVLEHNGAMLNISDATITYDDKRLELTKNELKILQTLFDNKERIVSRSGKADKPLTRRRVREKGEKDGRNAEGSERAVEQCGLHGLLPDRNAAGGAEAHGTAPGAAGAGRRI